MLKIAYLVENYHKVSATFIRDCAEGLAARVSRVTVYCVHKLVQRDETSLEIRPVIDSKYRSMLLRLRRRWIKTIHSKSSREAFDFRVEQKTSPFEHSLSNSPPDLIFAEYGPMGLIASRLAQRFKVPFVIHFHGHDASKQFGNPFYRDAIAQAISDAAITIVPSKHMKRLLRIQCGNVGPIEVIPYGPDLSRIESLLSRAGQRTEFPSVFALGRLTPKKNPLALLEAFAIVRTELPEARLTLVGDGELRDSVAQRIRQLKLDDSVVLTGALPQGDALERMAQHWVFAQHSVTASDGDQEGLPVAILEAMALRLPVVSTLHSGIPEAVDEGETGYLVREHDFEAMAERLIRLLKDPVLRERMREAARGRMNGRFCLDRRMERISELVNEVLPERDRLGRGY